MPKVEQPYRHYEVKKRLTAIARPGHHRRRYRGLPTFHAEVWEMLRKALGKNESDSWALHNPYLHCWIDVLTPSEAKQALDFLKIWEESGAI